MLQQLVVHQSDVPAAETVELTLGGNSVSGVPTLDVCNGNYPSDALRTARLQVEVLDASGDPVFSTEAVLYRNSAASAQALAELRSVVSRCPSTPVVSPAGEPTVTTAFNATPDHAWARTAGVDRQAYDFTTTDELGGTRRTVAVYLRRGRALVALYFNAPAGAQGPVGGQTTVPAIVALFERRLAAVPAAAITP